MPHSTNVDHHVTLDVAEDVSPEPDVGTGDDIEIVPGTSLVTFFVGKPDETEWRFQDQWYLYIHHAVKDLSVRYYIQEECKVEQIIKQ